MLLGFYTANSNVEVVLHTSEGGGGGGGSGMGYRNPLVGKYQGLN